MNNQYFFDVHTDKNLGGDQFGRPFFEAWLNGNSKLRPERFGHGEPVRRSVEEIGIEGLLAEWRKPPSLMFRRISAPKFVATTEWRPNKGKDPRLYPWGARLWLDRKARDGLALELFELLIRWFEPAFASVTTWEEARRKHFVKYPYYKNGKLIGTAERFVGADVLETLPGIYWLTYLTPNVIDRCFLAKLHDKILRRDERGGCLIRAYERSADIGSNMARSIESEITHVLGPDRFFDVKRWKPPEPETTEPASLTRH